MTIRENILLKDLTTFHTGGKARYFCEINSVEDINEAVLFVEKNNLPIFILGGGSNLLVADNGFSGLVMKICLRGISVEENDGKTIVVVGAGESWDSLVQHLIEIGFSGFEFLSGIPGTVGAAPVQNIGAYGSEVSSHIEWVNTFDVRTKKSKKFLKEECAFGYRDSIFKKDLGRHLIITEVAFSVSRSTKQNIEHSEILSELLTRGVGKDKATALDIREAVLAIRKRKLPDLSLFGTAGSFFKNPTIEKKQVDFLVEKYKTIPVFSTNDSDLKKLSAGWLIENAGCEKGLRRGGVGIYEKHALVLVNYGEGKSSEVFSLAKDIQKKVFDVFGVQLEFEVCLVGNF